MTSGSRTALFAKLHKVLKKHYKPVVIDPQRRVLDHLLFACVLEDAAYDDAEAAFAALTHTFFDWNEVRVTSIAELSEVMAMLADPRAAGQRLKRVLHAVFEASYSFDLEDKRKKNLGPTVKWFESLDGCTPFSTAYILQAALGGHAIPIDGGTMAILRMLDLVSAKDAETGNVPGMERAIAKSKGAEFASMLHQFGADFTANKYSPKIRELLAEIDPASLANLPKRRAPKAEKPREKSDDKSPDKPAGPVKPTKSDKQGKTKEAEKPAKGEKAEKAEKGGKSEKPTQAPKVERPAPGKPTPEKATAEKPVKPAKGEKPAEKAVPEKAPAGKTPPAKDAAGKTAPEKSGKAPVDSLAAQAGKKKPQEPAKPHVPPAKAASSKETPAEKAVEKKKPSPGVEKPSEAKSLPKSDAAKKKSPTAKLTKKKPR